MDGRNFELRPHKRQSRKRRILGQVFRLALIGAFLYIAYLGFTWRNIPTSSRPSAASSAGQVSPPASPSR